jgi:hypothetical protein
MPLIEQLVEHGGQRAAPERYASGCHLEEHDSQREEIRTLVQRFAERLLRRHVACGSKRLPGARLIRGDGERLGILRGAGGERFRPGRNRGS